MRSDGLLPYEITGEPGKSQVTGHAGLLPYCVLGMLEAADEEIGICGSQGWKDRDHVLSLALLNLAGIWTFLDNYKQRQVHAQRHIIPCRWRIRGVCAHLTS